MLSHEIMNALTPVTSLAGSASALMVEGTPAALEQVREALEIILRRAEGLERFVQGYRALARVPPPILRPVRASEMLREAAALFDASWGKSGVLLDLDVPQTDVVAQMDAGLVSQGLLNLLANAVEAALAGGSAPRVRLSAGADASGVVFLVMSSNRLNASERLGWRRCCGSRFQPRMIRQRRILSTAFGFPLLIRKDETCLVNVPHGAATRLRNSKNIFPLSVLLANLVSRTGGGK